MGTQRTLPQSRREDRWGNSSSAHSLHTKITEEEFLYLEVHRVAVLSRGKEFLETAVGTVGARNNDEVWYLQGSLHTLSSGKLGELGWNTRNSGPAPPFLRLALSLSVYTHTHEYLVYLNLTFTLDRIHSRNVLLFKRAVILRRRKACIGTIPSIAVVTAHMQVMISPRVRAVFWMLWSRCAL